MGYTEKVKSVGCTSWSKEQTESSVFQINIKFRNGSAFVNKCHKRKITQRNQSSEKLFLFNLKNTSRRTAWHFFLHFLLSSQFKEITSPGRTQRLYRWMNVYNSFSPSVRFCKVLSYLWYTLNHVIIYWNTFLCLNQFVILSLWTLQEDSEKIYILLLNFS